ncbi:hypothetical protein SPICUR_04095 [Spiribacter curvatus]|uniref:Uncharacterized protein n=1 Tax=Spiribacter curvatus TaxID=1335757 RepID=U5T133_9GAMM|nr:hypothetical protein SPICUR_04095 [Spiribacter curvatus]
MSPIARPPGSGPTPDGRARQRSPAQPASASRARPARPAARQGRRRRRKAHSRMAPGCGQGQSLERAPDPRCSV